MTTCKPTFCRICEPSCGLVAELDGDRVVRLKPNKAHPVTAGFACHKGINFLDVHNDPDRVNHPLKRVGGRANLPAQFERENWSAAIDDIAARLQDIQIRHGDSAVAGYLGNPMAFNCTAQLEVPAFFKSLNARYFSALTQDCANKIAASEIIYGSGNLHPVPDLANTDYFLCLGENPKVSHMSFISVAEPMTLIRGIVGRGGKVVYVNPRRVESVTPATGDWLPIRPDTDLYFLAAVLHTLDERGQFDEDVIARHGKNIDILREFIAPYSAENVADVTGVAISQIEQVASDWMAAERASVHMSTGVNMGRQGSLCYWLVQMLSFATGKLGKTGCNIYARGFYGSTQFGGMRNSEGFNPWQASEFGDIREVAGNLPANLLPDYIESEREPIRALIVFGGNPLLSVGGEQRMREAFASLELLVVVDLYRNATAEYADYVLPATDWLERADVNLTATGMQSQPHVHYSEAVVSPRAERREEWWVLARLNQAMNRPSLLDAEPPQPMKKIDGLLAMSGLSREALCQLPANTAVCEARDPNILYDEGIQFADKRVDCGPALLAEACNRAHSLFAEMRSEHVQGLPVLKLINLRNNYMHNSWLQNLQKLKRPNQLENPLHMAPADIQARALADGQKVVVENNWGRIEATLRADDSLHPGTVAMTHGWGNRHSYGLTVAQRHPGVNVNQLLPSGPGSYEKISNQAFMSGVPVEVNAAT